MKDNSSEWLDEILNAYLGDKYDTALPSRKAYLFRLAKQAILTHLSNELIKVNSPHYQISILKQDTRMGLWALCIAQFGKSVYGDVFRTKSEAEAELPKVLAQLNPTKESKDA